MAFGKPAEIRRLKNYTEEDVLWRHNIGREERSNASWERKWSWILKEYTDLSAQLQEISKKSNFLSDVNKNVREPDHRSIKPIPVTTNGQYGWIPSHPEFKLEKYGNDLPPILPLPESYILLKGLY